MNIKHIKTIQNYYGSEVEYLKTLEELDELKDEVLKILDDNPNKDNLIGEISDVIVCIIHLVTFQNISLKDIDRMIDYKLEREVKRIENNK